MKAPRGSLPPPLVLVLSILVTTVAGSGPNLPAILLKQAGDDIMEAPLDRDLRRANGSPDLLNTFYRVEMPDTLDLPVRRLQTGVVRAVDGLIEQINDPQRLLMLLADGEEEAGRKVLRSLADVETEVGKLQRLNDASGAEDAITGLEVRPRGVAAAWTQYWYGVRRRLGKVALYHKYFQGYVRRPENVAGRTLRELAESVISKSTPDTSILREMDDLHSMTTPDAPRGANGNRTDSLFPYIKSILEQEVHFYMRKKVSYS